MRAASSMSDRRPFVQEPMNATSIRVPLIGMLASEPMYASASGSAFAGIRSLTPTDCPGLMPHVTVGSIDGASSVTRSSYVAFLSEAIDRHHATALSHSAPVGANLRPCKYAKVVSSG